MSKFMKALRYRVYSPHWWTIVVSVVVCFLLLVLLIRNGYGRMAYFHPAEFFEQFDEAYTTPYIEPTLHKHK